MGRATRRNSNGWHGAWGEGIARERITRSLPVAPARASASGRAAHCPSCFSRQRGHLILHLVFPPSPRPPGGGWLARLLAHSFAFLTPFFTRDLPLFPSPVYLSRSPPLAPSSSASLPPPKTLFAIRRRTPVQRNFVQWRNLAITIARPRTPVIPYCLYFSLSRASPLLPVKGPTLSRLPAPRTRVALCIPPGQINGGRGGPFGPDSRVHL